MSDLKYVAFDLEITKEIPEGTEDWQDLRPFGISCAATLTSNGTLFIWPSRYTTREIAATQSYPASLSPDECRMLLRYLVDCRQKGFAIVTWNGLGFDFDVLAEEVGVPASAAVAQSLALDHIDVGFAMFCQKGFMVGLNTAAKGMRLGGKMEGMTGALAPVMWAQGREEQDKVLEYVAQDARTTAQVYEAIIKAGYLSWTSRSGRLNRWRPASRTNIHTVSEALALPEPDTSWMTDPWKRSKFYGWTGWTPDSGRASSDRMIADLEEQGLDE